MTKTNYNDAVQEHTRGLFLFVTKYLRNSEDARDIVQDVYEKLWLNREKVLVESSKSWLFTTAYHSLINFAVKKRRTDYTDQPLPDKGTMDRGMENREIVEKAVSILPPLQKSILLMRDLEGYDYKEIGKILSISESQVKVYLFRARMKVKKQLKELLEIA